MIRAHLRVLQNTSLKSRAVFLSPLPFSLLHTPVETVAAIRSNRNVGDVVVIVDFTPPLGPCVHDRDKGLFAATPQLGRCTTNQTPVEAFLAYMAKKIPLAVTQLLLA